MGPTKTLLTVFLHPDEVEHALYHLKVTLTEGDEQQRWKTYANVIKEVPFASVLQLTF
jgi:hypothetical protein